MCAACDLARHPSWAHLNQPLAERIRAYKCSSAVVVQRARRDLARAGRAAVHQHNQRRIPAQEGKAEGVR
jgi:hypothetical protein